MTITKWALIRWPLALASLLLGFVTHLGFLCWDSTLWKPATPHLCISHSTGLPLPTALASTPGIKHFTISIMASSLQFHMMWLIRLITIILIFEMMNNTIGKLSAAASKLTPIPNIPNTCSRPIPLPNTSIYIVKYAKCISNLLWFMTNKPSG